jgi:glycosyltransferase involved in cell wall biosynthesis
MADTAPAAAQIKTIYLPLSETFIYRALSGLRRWRPLVLAELIANREAFPLANVARLARPALWRRAPYALLRVLFGDRTLRAAFRPLPPGALGGARVLHAHFGEAGVASLPLLRAGAPPLVTSFYGLDAAQLARQPYGRWRYRRLFRAGAAFTAVSEAMRRELIALGAPAERTHVIRLGLDPEAIAFAPRRWPADGRVRLLTVGRLVEKKGTRYLLEALALLRERFPGLTITVVGDGPLRPELQRLALQRGIAERVRFAGALPSPAVIDLMAKSHLFALPSVTAPDGDQEGTPVALIEAQASGLPVLSTRHAGIPEVVLHGESGLLAPERDAPALAALLAQLLDRPERWAALGAAGRAHMCAAFDARDAAARLEALYDSVSAEC